MIADSDGEEGGGGGGRRDDAETLRSLSPRKSDGGSVNLARADRNSPGGGGGVGLGGVHRPHSRLVKKHAP